MSEEGEVDKDKIFFNVKKYFTKHLSITSKDLDAFLSDVHLDIWSSEEEKAFLWELLSKYSINEEVDYDGVCKGLRELLSPDEERESLKNTSSQPLRRSQPNDAYSTGIGTVTGTGNRMSITNTISQIDDDKIKQLRQVFSLLNLQNNGLISIAEIQTLLSRHKFIKIPQEELLSFLSHISDKATDNSHQASMIKINFELFSKAISLMEKQVLQSNSDFFAENINDSFDVTQDPSETIDEMHQMEQETMDYLSALSEIKLSLIDTIRLINANYEKLLQGNFDEDENADIVYKTIKEQSFIYESKLKDLDIFVRDMSSNSRKKQTKVDYFKLLVDDLKDNIKGLEDDYRKLYAKYNTNQPIEIDEQINKLLQEIDVANRLSDEKSATIERLQREVQEKEESYNTLSVKYNQALANEKESSKEVIRLRVDNSQLNKNYNFIVNEVLMKIQKEPQDASHKKFGLNALNRGSEDSAVLEKIQQQMDLTERQKELLTMNYEKLLQYALQLDINNQQVLDKNNELEKRIRELLQEIEEKKVMVFNEKQVSIVLRAENARFQNQLHELSKEIEVNARLRTSNILSRISLNRLSKMETNANALSNLKQISSAAGNLYSNPFGSRAQMKTTASKGGTFMKNSNNSMSNIHNSSALNKIGKMTTSSSTKGFNQNATSLAQYALNDKDKGGLINASKESGGMMSNAKSKEGMEMGANAKGALIQQGNDMNPMGTLNTAIGKIGELPSSANINFDNVRLSQLELDNTANKIQRLEEVKPESTAKVSEQFKRNLLQESSHVYVSSKQNAFPNTIKEEDEGDNLTQDKESLTLNLDNTNQAQLFSSKESQPKKDFNPSVIPNENFDIERESVQVKDSEGNIEDFINQGIGGFNYQPKGTASSQLFSFNPQFENSNEVKTSVIERDSSIASEPTSKFVRNEKKSLSSIYNQSKISLQKSQMESTQLGHNRCPTVDDISKLLQDEQSTISSYDFLNLRKNNGVIKMIEDFSDYSTSYEMFSDNIYFIEDINQKSKKILFMTSEFVYVLRPADLSLKKKFKRELLRKLYISTKNCNLIAFQFAQGDDLVIETLRRMDLLYYLRDLYKFKSFGKLAFKYSDEFNFKQKGKYITLHANENYHLTTANFANAQKMGYLEKMNSGYFSYYFKPKLVVLSNVGLMYFDEPDKPPQKLIPVIGSEIRSCDSKEFKKDNCFEIRFKKERYVFATKTPEEHKEWIDELNKMQKEHSVQIRNINTTQKK